MCIYDGDQDGFEINKEGYGSNAYCNKFQTTFNEHGMCYTYNNYELSLDKVCKYRDQQDTSLTFNNFPRRLTKFKLGIALSRFVAYKVVEKKRGCK